MSQHQQNSDRINAELHKAVERLDGPIEGRSWSEFGDDTKAVFTSQIEAILDAELSHRFGDESKVNVRIREALETIGEQLARDATGTEDVVNDV